MIYSRNMKYSTLLQLYLSSHLIVNNYPSFDEPQFLGPKKETQVSSIDNDNEADCNTLQEPVQLFG